MRALLRAGHQLNSMLGAFGVVRGHRMDTTGKRATLSDEELLRSLSEEDLDRLRRYIGQVKHPNPDRALILVSCPTSSFQYSRGVIHCMPMNCGFRECPRIKETGH